MYNDEVKAFIETLERKRGYPIGWRTYSTYYANSNGIIREYGVFLYEAGDEFWYEDFEREPTFLGFKLAKSKNAQKYVKYEAGFASNDVLQIRVVRKKDAQAVAKGIKTDKQVKTASTLARLFYQCVTEVKLRDGSLLYFELPDKTLQQKIESKEVLTNVQPQKGVKHGRFQSL